MALPPLSKDSIAFTLAPIRGITDAVYRNAFHQHFSGVSTAIAPFVSPGPTSKLKRKISVAFPNDNTPTLRVVPQILAGSSEELIEMCNLFFLNGFSEVNWNLGCPYPMVMKKKRGAALLSYPEQIESILETALDKLKGSLSIKTRLGVNSPTQLATLLPRLEQFPIQEIIIHGRTAHQMYEGNIQLDAVKECLGLTCHRVTLNGDIHSPGSFHTISKTFPHVRQYMIGRGILRDPFLVDRITGCVLPTQEEQKQQLRSFVNLLFTKYQQRLDGDAHLLDKMKAHWEYLCVVFESHQKVLKKIRKSNTQRQYEDEVCRIFEHEKLATQNVVHVRSH